MITAERREALDLFVELMDLDLDMRIGQMMIALGMLSEGLTHRDLYNIEDDQLPAAMQSHRANLIARNERQAARENRVTAAGAN